MNRLSCLILASGLTIGASLAIKAPAITDPREALRRDVANPYRWSDLAAVYQVAGDLARARACYQRAIVLSGQAPQIGFEAANFHFDRGEYEQALPLASRVLKSVPAYDDALFSHFDQLLPSDPAAVFVSIGINRRIIRAYTQHLVDVGDIKHARLSWRFARSANFADDSLTSAYLDAMLRAHHYEDAQREWVEYLGKYRGDYPDNNLLFNAGFEREPTGSPLDWRIQPSDEFETIRDESVVHSGRWSLKIKFRALNDIPYAQLSQTTYLSPGRYTLRAWVRSENIVNDGVQFEIVDMEDASRVSLKTSPIIGTSGWHVVSRSFLVPPSAGTVCIRVVRAPSGMYDGGIVWLDDFSLARF